MKNYRLHLIRHGISTDNEQDLLAGVGRDSALSPRGEEALHSMKDRYSYPPIQALFVSPLKRAVQTAAILYPEHRRILIAPLAEASYGALEGTPLQQVYDQHFFEEWMRPDDPVTPAGAETYREFVLRCSNALGTLLEGMMKSGVYEAAAVTHGGVIAAMLTAHGLPEQTEDMWYADNGAGYTLNVSAAMWMRSRRAEVAAIQPAGYMEALNRE